jgi:hypothetical protein
MSETVSEALACTIKLRNWEFSNSHNGTQPSGGESDVGGVSDDLSLQPLLV